MKCMLLLFIVFALALTVDPQITAVYDLIARVTSPVLFEFIFANTTINKIISNTNSATTT